MNRRAFTPLLSFSAVLLVMPVARTSQVYSQAPASVTSPARRDRTASTAEIARAAIPATATVIALDARGDTLALGSGFLVRSDGVLVTNWHVLEGASSGIVVLPNGERYERVSVLDGDPKIDVALLKVPGFGMPTLKVRSTVPAVGEHVVAVGSPLGLSQTVSEGIVSATRILDGRELVQITAPISPGSSGGAVLDDAGAVFAISTMHLKGGQQLNFAVPVRYAMGFLSSQPKERSIAAVFASTARSSGRESEFPDAAGESADLRSSASSATIPAPPRARSPRSTLDGTYAFGTIYNGGKFENYKKYGYLVASSSGSVFELAREDGDGSGFEDITAGSVTSFRTSSTGAVVLEFTDAVLDGYQTDDGGFYVSGTSGNPPVSIQIFGTPYEIPLSRQTGLYNVSVRTRTYESDDAREPFGSYTDWSGDMAAIVTNDSIFVVVMLANATGGSSGFTAAAPIDSEGDFQIVLSPAGYPGQVYRLTGHSRSGVIAGTWYDRRKNGYRFEGTFQAVRK